MQGFLAPTFRRFTPATGRRFLPSTRIEPCRARQYNHKSNLFRTRKNPSMIDEFGTLNRAFRRSRPNDQEK
jgi:hypothetical protein